MTRALVIQLLNALEYHQSQTRPIHNTELTIEAAREYLATEPSGERAELIAQLIRKADAWDHLHPTATRPNVCRKAADMLEADAQPKQVTCQIYGHVVGACVECNTHMEADKREPVCPSCQAPGLLYECVHCSANSYPKGVAQQANRAPLSDEQIKDIAADNSLDSIHAVARAIEAAHGIGAKP